MWVIKLEQHFEHCPGKVSERYTNWYIIAFYYYWFYSSCYAISIYPVKRLLMYKTANGVVKLNSTKQNSQGNFKKFHNKRSS